MVFTRLHWQTQIFRDRATILAGSVGGMSTPGRMEGEISIRCGWEQRKYNYLVIFHEAKTQTWPHHISNISQNSFWWVRADDKFTSSQIQSICCLGKTNGVKTEVMSVSGYKQREKNTAICLSHWAGRHSNNLKLNSSVTQTDRNEPCATRRRQRTYPAYYSDKEK